MNAVRLPDPTRRCAVPMRDGVSLDTYLWQPAEVERAPALLVRTPYSRSVNHASESALVRLRDAGYAIVMQQVRGIGASEGRFSFNSPLDRTDAYDTVEWIAAQPWCTGAVGMDGHSYAGMTQLTAGAARPPHLRCIAPVVPSVDFFREPPYLGGAFSRMHTLVWSRALQFESLLSETTGAFALHGFLTQPELLARWMSRPVERAADGELTGDTLQHYHDVLAHPTFDDWWRERSLLDADYARMDLPTLVVGGNFDPCTGVLALWRGLERHAARSGDRHLVIGPWDHNGSYAGGLPQYGSHRLENAEAIDPVQLRIEFFDRHLKGEGAGPALADRATVFITGANEWHTFDAFPPRGIRERVLYLASGGHANSSRGDGRLGAEPPPDGTPPDRFVDDPEWPIVGALGAARGPAFAFDLRERERVHDTLVYCSGPLPAPLTVLGEAAVELYVAVDAPDGDVAVWLADHAPDGSTTYLAMGQLRLRYREGFDRERPLVPHEPVRVRIPFTFVGHRVAAGHALRLLVGGSNFPLLDPNPHVAGPIATAREVRSAVQTLFHDASRPSRLLLPTLG